jgi:hypothetical protein
MGLQAVLEGRDGLLVPRAYASEAAVVEGLNVYPVGNLAEAVGFLSGQVDMDPESVDLEELFVQHSHPDEDFIDVKGQDYAKRALLIAPAGCHNVLALWSISPFKGESVRSLDQDAETCPGIVALGTRHRTEAPPFKRSCSREQDREINGLIDVLATGTPSAALQTIESAAGSEIGPIAGVHPRRHSQGNLNLFLEVF